MNEQIGELKEKLVFTEKALFLSLTTIEHLLKGIKQDFDDRAKTDPMDILDFEEVDISREKLEDWLSNYQKQF